MTINNKRQITTNVTWFFDIRMTKVKYMYVTKIKLKQNQVYLYVSGYDILLFGNTNNEWYHKNAISLCCILVLCIR